MNHRKAHMMLWRARFHWFLDCVSMDGELAAMSLSEQTNKFRPVYAVKSGVYQLSSGTGFSNLKRREDDLYVEMRESERQSFGEDSLLITSS